MWNRYYQPCGAVEIEDLSPHHCQDQFFTNLISVRGLGVRGWLSDKTEVLCSVVVLPKW